jgi:triacylglycerol lipase
MRFLFAFCLSFSVFSQDTVQLPTYFDFSIPEVEINCMQYFDKDAVGYNPINAFILSKMSELMYPERLDYQLRYLQNNCQPLDSLRSTEELKEFPLVNNSNFNTAFSARFRHYFNDNISTDIRFIEKVKLDTVRVLGFKTILGYDPEFIIISHGDLILLVFRGTDDVAGNIRAEWKGTDFNYRKTYTDSSFNNAQIHKGFWKSFEIMKDDLFSILNELDAKNKSIWLTGHSLGGAMAIISGAYMEANGFPVQNIYTFAAPRAFGDTLFAQICSKSLPNKIHRFEYYLDPVSYVSSKKYTPVGIRYWFDQKELGSYKLYSGIEERHKSSTFLGYRKRPFADDQKKEAARLKRAIYKRHHTGVLKKFYNHNTQWYVKGCYQQLSAEQKLVLPLVDDSFPFIYYGWEEGK